MMWFPLLVQRRGAAALLNDERPDSTEIDVRMRGDEVVVAHAPEDVADAVSLNSFLLGRRQSGALVDTVPVFFVDVKEADALAPTVEHFANIYERGLAIGPAVRAICKLPRWAGRPRWATPAALQRASNVAVLQCDIAADTALNQDPASRGYAYWDDFAGSGWRTAAMVRRAHLAGLRVILCSDEVYKRRTPIEEMSREWRGAYGILTDRPKVWGDYLQQAGEQRGT